MITASHAVIVSTVSLAIAFLFCALRCYTRFVIVRNFGVDDAFVVLAFLSSVGLTVLLYEGKRAGLGQSVETLTEDDVANFLKVFWATIMCYSFGFTVVKNAVILQCLRFIVIGRMRLLCWASIAIVTALGIVCVLTNLFQCTPVAAFWDRSIPKASCINLIPFWWFVTVTFTLTDIVALLIPILTVKDMNLPFRQKAALIAVFAFGGLACVASVIRISSLVILERSLDITKNNVASAMSSTIEFNIEIICVCVPPLKPLVIALFPSLLVGNDKNDSNVGSNYTGTTIAVHSNQQRGKSSEIELVLFDEGGILDA